MEISEALLNSIVITVMGTLMAFLVAWFWYQRNLATRHAEVVMAEHQLLMARVAELEAKERAAGQVVTPIITAMQGLLIKQLTHADKPELDALLVKVGPPDILTDAERARLLVMLKERTRDMSGQITASERDAAVILPYVMKMAAEEQANFGHAAKTEDLKLATIISIVGPKTGPSKETKKAE